MGFWLAGMSRLVLTNETETVDPLALKTETWKVLRLALKTEI